MKGKRPNMGPMRDVVGTTARGRNVELELECGHHKLSHGTPARTHCPECPSAERGIFRFVNAILERTPNGEYIAVQYHPNGDWTVANEAVSSAGALSIAETLRIQTRFVARLCDAFDEAERGIGHENIADLVREVGPANERAIQVLGGRAEVFKKVSDA